MHLRRFSNWFKKEQIPDKPNIIQWAYMGLFTCLTKDLEKASLPVIIRLTLEKQHLDYRIVADVTFEYSHCGRCGVELCSPDKANVCFYCIAPMCDDCWDDHGHCGHAEAVKMNLEAHIQPHTKGAPKEEQQNGQGDEEPTGED